MQPARHEHGADAEARRAGNIGIDPVADCQNLAPRHGAPCQCADGLKRKQIDRRVWLAGINDATPFLLVEGSERAGAIDELVAAFHQMIGISADHRELPRGKRAHEPDIVVRRLGLVVEET